MRKDWPLIHSTQFWCGRWHSSGTDKKWQVSIPMWGLSQTCCRTSLGINFRSPSLCPHLTSLLLSFSIPSLAQDQHWHLNCINKPGPCLAGRRSGGCERVSGKTKQASSEKCSYSECHRRPRSTPQIKKNPAWFLQGLSQRSQAVSKVIPFCCFFFPSDHFLSVITISQLISCLFSISLLQSCAPAPKVLVSLTLWWIL